jgi:serine/threonine protein kinase
MPLSAGEKLGPYEILAPIGAGGMGDVYKARDTRLDRIVAVKVSKTEFSERFEREARAVAALNHSNICTLHDVGPNYLVMEYIEGQPLKGPLPLDQALRYPPIQLVACGADSALAMDLSADIFHAVTDGLLVNIQSDVVHKSIEEPPWLFSESTFPLSSAFYTPRAPPLT